jgi:hypothetical protein
MSVKSAFGALAACALLAGLAACGNSGGDSQMVQKCISKGGPPDACRCVDRIYRAEFNQEEYAQVEKVALTGDISSFVGKGNKLMEGPPEKLLALSDKMIKVASKAMSSCGRK